jgi:glutathione synthase
MDLLFVADPLESFKPTKDSTFAMMREAARRGHRLMACEPKDIRWQKSGAGAEPVTAFVRDIELTGSTGPDWFRAAQQPPHERPQPLRDVDAVLMRKDPPFDPEYLYATHLLEQAEREGARVFNRPRALRDHPEKLAILEFPQHIAPTLVTRDADDVRRFHAAHGEIILKPLDGMGGMGIFRVGPDGLNLGSITETLNRHGATTLMVQRFLPEIAQGDKRILVIDGVPVPFVPGAHPAGQRDPRQPGRRRQGRGAAADRRRPPHRRGDRPAAGRPRAAAGGAGRDRRVPDRDQRHQPDLLPGDHRADRLRRREDLRRRAGGAARAAGDGRRGTLSRWRARGAAPPWRTRGGAWRGPRRGP